MCCSMSQCVAVCCSVLQCVAMCHISMLQCVAVCCSVSQLNVLVVRNLSNSVCAYVCICVYICVFTWCSWKCGLCVYVYTSSLEVHVQHV